MLTLLISFSVVFDPFMRLGRDIITPDNEPEYLEIATALHTVFDYERWAV
jgi:hypothetical protein